MLGLCQSETQQQIHVHVSIIPDEDGFTVWLSSCMRHHRLWSYNFFRLLHKQADGVACVSREAVRQILQGGKTGHRHGKGHALHRG